MFSLILAAHQAELTAIHEAVGGPTPIDLMEHFREHGRAVDKQGMFDMLAAKQLDGNFFIFIGESKDAAAVRRKINELGFPEAVVFAPKELWLATTPDRVCNLRYRAVSDRGSYALAGKNNVEQASTEPNEHDHPRQTP